MELLSIGKFAEQVGISQKTLRRMHESGEFIPAKVTKGGTRYYSTEQISEFIGKSTKPNEKDRIIIGYCRVSTPSQKDDLEKQVENLKTYMLANGYSFEIITDIGSGINYNKKGLKELIRRIENDEVSKIIVLYKDRLVRFGFELIEYLCELHDVEIEIVDNTEYTKEEELTQDLIQIVTVFANRLYGSRSKKTKQLIDEVKNNVTSEKDTA